MLIDESSVQLFVARKCNISSPVGTRFEGCYTQATIKHPPGVMILGGMSAETKAGLCQTTAAMLKCRRRCSCI